jgi:hypothetical protein
MSIQVSKYIPCARDGSNILAIVSFYIPEWNLYLHQATCVRSPKGGYFIGFPSRKYTKEGKDFYARYYDFEGNSKDRFQVAAKKAIEEYVAKNKQEPVTHSTKTENKLPPIKENEQTEFDLF